MSDQLHRLLQRQLRRLEISADQTPDAIAWSRFLAVISRAYASAAEDRYLIERSLDLSSREMEALYDDLRRTSETQIARERDRLRSILEAIADGLCVVDHAGCVQVENRSARALLGVGGETLKGGSVLDRFVLRQEGSLVAVPGEAALAAVATAQEAEARFDDSEFLVGEVRRPVACTLTPLIEHGQRVGAVFLFHDMSVLRRSEHDLRQANEALLVAKRELQATNDELDRRVRERTRDLEIQNQRLEAALTSLRRTQEQLVQAEKMASLGLLVAGIAHEIKNPLNFVTNFAELSLELLDESHAELTSGGEPRVSAVVDELHANLTRIHAHGHRADGIINSMLMHSRERPGEEVVVDFNALVRDHVALAYQGFRADDRLFRADVELHLAPGLPRVRLAYGDVARVIVNLISNACHALRERLRQADAAYRPTIEVTTAREQDALVLRVRDNGVGIPLAIQRRVFDPFFTTKPPGEGTGLGLSMSYDIIVQQLGGGLELDSVVDDHTEVRLRLPLVAADADA